METLKSINSIWIISFLLFLLGCDSSITNEQELGKHLESESLSAVTQQVTDPDLTATLAQVRRATSSYHDVVKAEDDGYEQASPFVPGMGYHYVNGALVDDNVNPTQPEALVYVDNLVNDDARRLVAVEYVIPDPNEDMSESKLDNKFPGADGDKWHYDPHVGPGSWTLHAWIWYPNPEGVFHSTNPRVDIPGIGDGS
jgi:hypothetical protein